MYAYAKFGAFSIALHPLSSPSFLIKMCFFPQDYSFSDVPPSPFDQLNEIISCKRRSWG